MAPPHPSRVAVIVTPGVGDDERGATLDSFVDGLVRHGHFAAATRDDVTVPPPSPERPPAAAGHLGTPPSPCAGAWSVRARSAEGASETEWVPPPTGSETVARQRLYRASRSRAAAQEIDAYEMHWADLSRFPVGLRRIVFTLFALVLELGRMGRQALAGLAPARGGRALGAACLSLRALASWMAIVVIPVTALMGILGVALTVALLAPSSDTLGWTLSLLVAGVGIILLLMIGRGLEHAGWRGPLGLGAGWPVAACAGIVGATWAGMQLAGLGGDTTAVELANLVIVSAAWPLRIAWLVLVVLWVSAAFWTVVLMMSASKREAPVRRAGFVALLSAGIPSVLLGLVSAITLAAAGTISIQILGGNTWGEADRDLVCLGSANDWTLGSCDALRDEPMALITPKDWLIDLFGTILEPLGVATLLLVGLGLLALLVVMVFTAASLIRTWGRKRVPRRVTDYVPLLVIGRVFPRVSGVSERLGPALSRLLRRANSAASTVVLVLLSFIIAGTTLVSWLIKPVGEMSLIEPLLGLFGPGFSGVMATILATGLVAARFLPGELTSTTGGALGPLRSGLDIVGDVANYIRPHPTSPRFGIVARYRALIDRITTMPHADGEVGYAGIVIVSHSQGSVYTAATLFGDRHREPAIYPLDVMGEDGPASRLAEMQGVALLTCGSPIQQTYDRFFAGQYADWISRRGGDLAPLSTAWINAYRPGDYVGRAIHADPLSQPAVLVPGAGPVLIDGDESEIVEYCLDSPGSHTGYWNERDIALLANHLIERVAGEVDPLPTLPRSGGGN